MDNKLTIHNLEVSFDVDGASDEDKFAMLFDKHFNRRSRQEFETKTRECRLESEMALLNRHKEDRQA